MTQRPAPLLTPEQAATELNISLTTLHRLRRQGGGPQRISLGPRTVRYSPAALDQWRADHQVDEKKCGHSPA